MGGQGRWGWEVRRGGGGRSGEVGVGGQERWEWVRSGEVGVGEVRRGGGG